MRSQLRFITGLALSLCVTLAMVGDSEAFWKKLRERKEKQKPQQEQRNSNTFAASGTFTGSIRGLIEVGTKQVFIGDKTSIYISGQGTAEAGHYVNKASLYVGGVINDGFAQAAFVVVRPAPPKFQGFRRPERTSRDRHTIPSPTNPNVGVWMEGYE